jgi:7-cyano-7-deazaguanine synthase in queuosine biosynthesis
MSNLKKTVKIKESHLVDLIDNIVNEAISAKKKTSINEMDATMGAGEQDLKVQAEKLINMIKSKVPATYFSNVSKNIVAQREAILAFVKMLGVEPQNVAKIITGVKGIAKAEPAAAPAPMAESKKTVKLSESNLVDLIDGILSEAVEVKKQEWINEQADSRKLMEAKISKLENALKRITEGK